MSVLDAILRFKELESAKTRADIGMISNAFQNFQQSKQNSLLLEMEKKRLDVSLASRGLKFGDNGQIVPATDLIGSLGTTKEWKPRTKEEAFEFEREKVGIKAGSPQEINKQERQDLLDSTKIREEFLNRPEVKEYTLINTQVKSMDALLGKAKEGDIDNKVALDQALITMFNKLTDPNSVVRESEYARTPQNLPLANRFSGAFQKLEKGGAGLTDSDRDALVWGAKVIANERGNTYNQTLKEYSDLAGKYKIDESLITRGKQPHQEYKFGVGKEKSSQNFKSEAEALSANLPKGTIVIINGRKARID